MKHNIRLIGLDMDKTTLNNDIQMTEYTKNVLKKAIAQGIELVAITGRPLTAVPKEFLEIPGVRFTISANGGRTHNKLTGETLHASLISQETISRLIHLFEEYESITEVYKEGQCYLNKDTEDIAADYVREPKFRVVFMNTRLFVDDIFAIVEECPEGMEKIDAVFRDRDEQAECRARIENDFPEVKVVGSSEFGLEITKAGTDKGASLLALGESLGISRDEIMAIGDGENDISMIQAAGVGVAMLNGSSALKAAADYVSDEDNDHDGAAKMIEKLALV